jgi:hypothetical protein
MTSQNRPTCPKLSLTDQTNVLVDGRPFRLLKLQICIPRRPISSGVRRANASSLTLIKTEKFVSLGTIMNLISKLKLSGGRRASIFFSTASLFGIVGFTSPMIATAQERVVVEERVPVEDIVPALVQRIPDAANSIAVVRVHDILKSPKALAEHWGDKDGSQMLFGSSVVPLWVDTIVVGSQVRLGSVARDWSVGVLSVPPKFSLDALAKREKARVEELGGRRAVRGRRDAFFVDLGDRVLGVMSPAYRQNAARWVRRASSAKGAAVSDYLAEAAVTPAQILLAIDLQDSFDNFTVRDYLSQQPILKTSRVPVIDVVEQLKSLRGVRVSAVVTDAADGRISLDFGKSISIAPEVLKALTISTINDQGLHIPELEAATPTVAGNTFALDMDNMSDESLRAIMSLIVTAVPERGTQLDSVAAAVPLKPGEIRSASASDVPDEDTSKAYFDAVNKIIDDLDKSLQHVHNYVLTATWHDNYALRIEHLPIAGVSPEMVDYGIRVKSRLRGLAASLRGVVVTVNADQGTLVYNANIIPGSEDYGVWGAYEYHPDVLNWTSNLQAVREKQMAAVLKGAAQREQIWDMIRADRNNLIRKVVDPNAVVPKQKNSVTGGPEIGEPSDKKPVLIDAPDEAAPVRRKPVPKAPEPKQPQDE